MQKRTLISALVACGLSIALVGCGEEKKAEAPVATNDAAKTVLTVGASPVPHADILHHVAPRLAKQGIELKVVEFSDYVQPNLALADGDIDANFFQHKPYLDEFSQSRGLKLEGLVAVHIEPMGVYSHKVKNLNALKRGAKIAIPNDPTNGGRALKVLESAGLITLKADASTLATVADITDNPKHIAILEIESAQLPRSLDDVDAAVINSNYALGANLNPTKDALAIESKDSPYANLIVVRAGETQKEPLQKLKAVLTTPETKKFLEEKYQGSIVPAF